MVPAVSIEETKRFAGMWTLNGVAVTLDDITLKFATDYANVVLGSFFQNVVPGIVAQVVTQELNKASKPSIIAEGD